MSTNDIPIDWGNWTWNATSIGTIATLGGILVISIICLCISKSRQKRRARVATSSTETLVDDEEAQMKNVYETPSIPTPQPVFLPSYRCSKDDAPSHTPRREPHRYQTQRTR